MTYLGGVIAYKSAQSHAFSPPRPLGFNFIALFSQFGLRLLISGSTFHSRFRRNLFELSWSITRVPSVLVKKIKDIILLYGILKNCEGSSFTQKSSFTNKSLANLIKLQRAKHTDPSEHFKKELEVTLLAIVT
uniref:Uncharacterized protein n=1 Tax=Solanum lycopersicum TaxID=4081 RepID=A0A3Q7EIU2_SOLLC